MFCSDNQHRGHERVPGREGAPGVREYKEQTSVELQFKAIKEPEFVGAMYVKKPERLEALAYVVLLAVLNARRHPSAGRVPAVSR